MKLEKGLRGTRVGNRIYDKKTDEGLFKEGRVSARKGGDTEEVWGLTTGITM